MLKLYHFNNSVCSQKVRLALAAKGLDYEQQVVDLIRIEQYDPAYLALNPKGVVPTLVHDGRPIIESTLICEYLDDAFPEPPLKPADAAGRAAMRLWSKAVDEGLHDGVTAISFSAMFRDRMRDMTEDELANRYRNVGDPLRTDRHRSVHEYGVASPFVYRAIAAYEIAFKSLEATLADGRAWIVGDRPSLAEINLAPYAARLEYLTLLDLWLAERPRVQAWWDRVKAEPIYQTDLSGLLSGAEIDEMRATGARIKDQARAQRETYLSRL
jgi:glutathione S-transferase